MFREPGCIDCRQITSGDCGKHGPKTYAASFAQPRTQSLPVKYNPRTAAEWAKSAEGWANRCSHGPLAMCCECADAYARQQVEAFRERAAQVAESHQLAPDRIAAVIRALTL